MQPGQIERLLTWAQDELKKREAVEEDRLRERQENEKLRAALWPFAIKGLHGTSVCADDFRRAKDAIPHAPDMIIISR